MAYGRFVGGKVQMFIADADGTHARRLRPGSGDEGAQWSPDGKKVAVATDNGGRGVGSVLNPDGSGRRVFVPPKGGPNLPCTIWSPDAKRLACEGYDDAHPKLNGLYTVSSVDGRSVLRLTNQRDIACSYSPDGRRLLFLRTHGNDEATNDLMTIKVDGTDAQRLTKSTVGFSCDWSPDGKTILTELDGKIELVTLAGKMSTVEPKSGGQVVNGVASRGSFSPDGSHIIFSFANSDTDQGFQTDIYTMKSDGSELTQLTHTPENEEFGYWGR